MPDKITLTIDDLEVVTAFSVTPHKTPPSVIVGLRHFAGRAARLGVPNPKTKLAKLLLEPHDAQQLARDLLKAAEEALSPSTH